MKNSRFILFLSLSLSIQCTLNTPVADDHFSRLENVRGGEKPTSVVVNPLNYPTSTLLQWSVSFDPDSEPANSPVANYRIYQYVESIPSGSNLYAVEFLVSIVQNLNTLDISTLNLSQSGTHYFGVTGFDGNRESHISNLISISIP